jgi:hypothetical protein
MRALSMTLTRRLLAVHVSLKVRVSERANHARARLVCAQATSPCWARGQASAMRRQRAGVPRVLCTHQSHAENVSAPATGAAGAAAGARAGVGIARGDVIVGDVGATAATGTIAGAGISRGVARSPVSFAPA